MTLVTRLTLFFLVTLALVLAGFSVTLFSVAHVRLHREVDHRLDATLNVLAAAADVGANGVEWEPRHLIAVGSDGGDAICWEVTDNHGERMDGSNDSQLGCPLGSLAVSEPAWNATQDVHWNGEQWRLRQRRVPPGEDGAAIRVDQGLAEGRKKKRHTALVLAVAAPLKPVHGTLRTLSIVLTALSLGLWSAAALLGRWLCRRALAPLTSMAATARTMTADELGQRLPSAGTGDELEELGRAFNDLLARLHESFQRQRRFTADASHQLRTPLTAILGQIEVALRRDRPPGEYQRILTLVKQQSSHLRQIVETLLFLARADSEAKLPRSETIDLNRWLIDHLRTWSGHARAADLRVDVESDQPLPVEAQPPLLAQLLDNLLDNACKYSAPGSPIVVRTAAAPRHCRLTVEDAGVGIPAHDLPHIFEPFHRSAQARQRGTDGVGLGLAIAQRIATALGGRFQVTSREGSGSRFTLELPTVELPALAAAAPTGV